MVIASVVFTMLGVSIADISLVKAATTTNLEVLKENQSIDDKLREKILSMAEGMYSENVTIGEPVSVYNSDEDKFFTAYPLLNNMNECVLLAQVDGEVVNLTTDMKWYENMGSKLGEGQYIIYVNAGKVYAENNEESVELEDTKYCIQN